MKKKEFDAIEQKCNLIFKEIEGRDFNTTKKSMNTLINEINLLKSAMVEEVQFIKAQTITTENSKSLMSSAKERLSLLKLKMNSLIPFIKEYEGSLRTLTPNITKINP